MSDALSRLLAVEPLPRGERLARWSVGDCVPWDDRLRWVRMWYAYHFDELDAESVRAHARPLRLARERLREARAAYVECEAQLWAARGEAADLRAGHTCREGARVDCPACDAVMRRARSWWCRKWCAAEARADRAAAKLVTWEQRWQRMLYKQRAYCEHADVWRGLRSAANTRRDQDNPEVRGPVHRVAMREATRARIAMHAAGRGVPR